MGFEIFSKKHLTSYLSSVGYSKIGGTKHEKWFNEKIKHTVVLPRSKKSDCRPMLNRLYKEVKDLIK